MDFVLSGRVATGGGGSSSPSGVGGVTRSLFASCQKTTQSKNCRQRILERNAKIDNNVTLIEMILFIHISIRTSLPQGTFAIQACAL